MTDARSTRTCVWLLLFAAVCAAALALTVLHSAVALPGFGTLDFQQYWCAHKLLAEGKNPYDPAAMLTAEQALGYREAGPIMMWNPPWVLFLLRPVLTLPFITAAKVWVVAQLMLLMLSAALSAAAIKQKANTPFFPAAALAFFPLYQSMWLGQVSVLLAFGSAGSLYCLVKGRPFFSGLFLSLLTIKPHLFFLLPIVVIAWCIKHRSPRPLLGLACGTVGAAAAVLVMRPEIFQEWLTLVLNPPQDFITISSFRSGSLADAARGYLGGGTEWRVLLPVFGLALFALTFVRSIRGGAEEPFIFNSALSLSLITAPYCWVYDALALLPVFLASLAGARRRRLAACSALGVQAAAFTLNASGSTAQHQYFWLAPFVFFAYLLSSESSDSSNVG